MTLQGSHLAAFGRIFSGTIRKGQDILILQGRGKEREQHLPDFATVGSIFVPSGSDSIETEELSCGNVCQLTKVDHKIVSTATIASDRDSFAVRSLQRTHPYLFTCAVSCSTANLPKLLECSKIVLKVIPLIHAKYQDTGELVMQGSLCQVRL
jgi:U5 small nuclear ribonucleoprotein component